MCKLYHYTTFGAMDNILKSRSLWLGNVHYMNDCNEMKQLFMWVKKELINKRP